MLAKSVTRGADALILDLEDAVAPNAKIAARSAAIAFAASPDALPTATWVRVNSGALGMDDIDAICTAPGIDGVWLPKAEPGTWLDDALDRIVDAGIGVGILVESARGLSRLSELPEFPPNSLLQLGEADLSASLAISGSDDQLLVYRSMVVLECAARGLPAPIAPVSVKWDDPAEFRAQSERLREWGFVGRACIHPAQVTQANTVWQLSDASLEHARAIIREFELSESEGVGAFRGPDGSMVDRATVRWARSVVASATERR